MHLCIWVSKDEKKKKTKDEREKENDKMQRLVLTSEFAYVYQSSSSFLLRLDTWTQTRIEKRKSVTYVHTILTE